MRKTKLEYTSELQPDLEFIKVSGNLSLLFNKRKRKRGRRQLEKIVLKGNFLWIITKLLGRYWILNGILMIIWSIDYFFFKSWRCSSWVLRIILHYYSHIASLWHPLKNDLSLEMNSNINLPCDFFVLNHITPLSLETFWMKTLNSKQI